jgi:hypothetical protein
MLILAAGSLAKAQVNGLLYANGQDYFSSDSDTFNYQSPFAPANPGTGLTTVNALNALNGLSGAPLGGSANAFNGANSFSFAAPYGYSQVDPLPVGQKTAASVSVQATYSLPLSPFVTAPRIQEIPSTGYFNGLHQAANAPGYALDQFNFDAFYSVGSNGVLPAVKTVTATINGNLVASAASPNPFAEFGYEINYYEILGSSAIPLGSAGAYQSWNVAGPFAAIVTGPPANINGFPFSTAFPELEVTGTIFMAGDPAYFDADVEDDVPEPVTLGIVGISSLMLLARRRRPIGETK